MKQGIFNVFMLSAVIGLGIIEYLDHNSPVDKTVVIDEDFVCESDFLSKSPEEGLMEALDYYEIKHPDIVYAQAVLETGHFSSDLCINGNNLFGLYNSRNGKYHTFNHWVESVEAYKRFVQYKYKPPSDYYRFLEKIGYAEDPEYIKKVKNIVKRNDKRGCK